MKREFLQNIKVGDAALPSEVIDAIMAENGRDVEAAKKPFADYLISSSNRNRPPFKKAFTLKSTGDNQELQGAPSVITKSGRTRLQKAHSSAANPLLKRKEWHSMNFTQPFSETKETFTKWWKREDLGRPLMKLIGRDEEIVYPPYPATHREFRMDAHYCYAYQSAEFENATFYADTLPVIDLNIGAGSVAVYMGSEPIFRKESVWFSPIIQDGNLEPLKSLAYNPDSYWLKEHLRQVGILKELTKGQPYRITIPDLVESLDIVAAFCSPNELCYLLMDEPELIHQAIEAVDSCYFKYYDAFYDLVKDPDRGSNFT
ncbi:MAG: hypothetical protein PUC59_03145 [Firmicutes bacterium]|nr:hypothetical protein [Bacillota bacterium]